MCCCKGQSVNSAVVDELVLLASDIVLLGDFFQLFKELWYLYLQGQTVKQFYLDFLTLADEDTMIL